MAMAKINSTNTTSDDALQTHCLPIRVFHIYIQLGEYTLNMNTKEWEKQRTGGREGNQII